MSAKGPLDHPEWYLDWRHQAVHQLQERNAELAAEFRLGAWQRYHYDIDAGSMVFSDDESVKVAAEIQVVGTTSARSADWLWAWANSEWPADRVSDAVQVREFGQRNGICELTHEKVSDDDLNDLGWRLTAVAARLTNALGAYRPKRDEGGGLYLLFKSIRWVD
jgi:hypothetical protein